MQNSTSQTRERYDELLALMDGDQELLQELIDVFLEDAPQRIDGVRRALAAGDAEALYQAAHALKGSAGNFGAPDVVSRAMHLEAHAREDNLDAAAAHFALLEMEMAGLIAELTAVRHRP